MLVVACSATLSAASIEVKGRVTDSTSGLPLAGCSVFEKGAKNWTFTDADGNYAITINRGGVLLFALLSYQKVEVRVQSPVIDVVMMPSPAGDSIVVVSYQAYQRERPQMKMIGLPANGKAMFAGGAMLDSESSLNIAARDCQFVERNSEEYGHWKENRFAAPSTEPLSTFSLDVDGAAYSNARSKLNRGELPEQDAVRVEEFVNYFPYRYAQPKGNDPVGVECKVFDCPWADRHKLVRIAVKARSIETDKLPASNFVFLIDVSGSMYGADRLDLVKKSVKLLADNLRSNDRVAVVVYAGAAGLVLPSTSGDDGTKIKEAIDNLTAGGSTAGGAGIELAYRTAEKNFIEGGNNRVILCTDGDFNVGVRSADDLERLIAKKRDSGVYLTVLCYGRGNYKDERMQRLAEAGNGNQAYIDNIQEASRVLIGEFGSTLFAAAKDVKIQVEFNPATVAAYRLVGYESRLLSKEDFNDDRIDAGDLGVGHSVTAFYEVLPAGVGSDERPVVDDLRYSTDKGSTAKSHTDELMTVKLRYKLPDSDRSQLLSTTVKSSHIDTPDGDDRFAVAAAMFAQLLRGSKYSGKATYAMTEEWARGGFDNDPQGYRREMVRLIETARQLEATEKTERGL